jgi:hypothetical protein
MRLKSLSFDCHSGLDPESSTSKLDSCFRRNDISKINIKKCQSNYKGFGEFYEKDLEVGVIGNSEFTFTALH